MPARQRSHNLAAGDRNYHAELDRALKLAHKRLSRGRTRRFLSLTFSIPVLLAAAWLAATRFTFLDLPWWPVLFAPVLWFLSLRIWVARNPITRSRCARYLNSSLELDERALTCLEMEGRSGLGSLSAAASTFIEHLYADTAVTIQQRIYLLPSSARSGSTGGRSLAPLLAAVAAIVLLAGTIFLPSSVAGVKSQQNAVRSALDAQAQKLADVRAELVKRPDVPDNLKATISAELQKLEAELRTSQLDRSQALAEIAATEDRLRDLLPSAAADFEPLVRASQQIQSAAAGVTEWDPLSSKETGDLGLAADASDYVKSYINQFSNVQGRVMASALERASSLAADKDPELAQHLADAAAAIRTKDVDKATAALSGAEARFRAAAKEQQAAEALESTLARLDDGRQTIAKAGVSNAKRGQVGFRRSAPTADQAAGSDQQASDGSQGGDTNGANGANIGQNQPSFGASSGPGPGTMQQGGNSGAGGSGTGGSRAPNPSGGAAGGQGSGAGGGNPTGQSPIQGAINGPIRVGGASSGGSDAQGYGTGTATSPQGQGASAQGEQIYVPGKGSAAEKSGTSGQFAPPNSGSDAVGGRVGDGTTDGSTGAAPGLGQLTKIRTPYNEVLGQYSERATQALERAYVPPDAKEYVKNYFTELGKQSNK